MQETECEKWGGNILQFEKYIETKEEADFEGIWEVANYKIGIRKEGVNYIGFIIESGSENWKSGMVKLKIEQEGDKLKSTFYTFDYSPVLSENPELIGDNYLQIGQIVLKRLSPTFPSNSFFDNYFKSIYAQKPYLEELNTTTLYMRIPSFVLTEKQGIDSVLTANRSKILKTENLIIDLRNNGGGGGSYANLRTFLYTNPIRIIWVEYLSTTLNNQRFLDYANSTQYDFSVRERQRYKEDYDKLQSRLGEFVNLAGKDIVTYQQDIIYEYPKNVGILIDKGCASATESFLLDAKQSKKVKLFGTTTRGAFDMANIYSVESPCKEFKLWYCLSRNLGIPDMVIDEIGLQPDYYLDKTIPQYKWVEFVNDVLNQ